jgi:hypothetical protein
MNYLIWHQMKSHYVIIFICNIFDTVFDAEIKKHCNATSFATTDEYQR